MPCARNLKLWREGGLTMFKLSTAEVAMGMEDDARRTGDGYKIPAG
jgi:hypothetical protein